ncbi:MAG TPA: GNAT family N-acetyltransferase [Balneolales bacterium]|nr:GNAT family N-acetyltransferase [Balneolales bacterium]
MIEPERTYWSVSVIHYTNEINRYRDLPTLSIEVVDDVTAMQLLEEEWDTLSGKSSSTIYQTYEWQYYWWKHFANKPEHHLFIVLFKSDKRVVGIAPFFIQSFLLMHIKWYSRLMLLGSGLQDSASMIQTLDKKGPCEYLDILVESGFEDEVSNTLVSFMDQQSHLWDDIMFQNIREDGFIYRYLLPKLKKKNYGIKKHISEIRSKIILPSLQHKIRSTTSKRTNNIKSHNQEQLLQHADYSIKEVSQKGKIDGILQTVTHINEMNAQDFAEENQGLFSDQQYIGFLRELTKAMTVKNRLWLKSLRFEGKNIAILLGFDYNKRFYTYASVVDNTHQNDLIREVGPGIVLFSQMVDEARKMDMPIIEIGRSHRIFEGQHTVEHFRNWEIIIRTPKKSAYHHQKGKQIIFSNYHQLSKLKSTWKYENSIVKSIAGNTGKVQVIPEYLKLIGKRLSKNTKKYRLKTKSNVDSKQGIFASKETNEHKKQTDLLLDIDNPLESFGKVDPQFQTEKNGCGDFIKEMVTEEDHLENLSGEWNELESNFGTPLLSHDWYLSNAQTFCPPDKLKMISIKSGDKLRAIAPLSVKGRYSGKMEFVGSSVLNEPGGMIYNDRFSLTALIKALLDLKKPLYLKGMNAFSPEIQILEKTLKSRSFLKMVSEERLPWVAVDGQWKDFEKKISSSRRSSLRRLQRLAEKKGKVKFEVITPNEENLEEYLNAVFNIEAASWKGRTGTAMKFDPALSTFFRLYSQRAAKKGQLYFFFLKVDDELVAVQLNILHANRLWIFKIGHNEAWSWCSPGILLMHKVIKYCFDNRLRGCEFLGSNEPWLHIWANEFHSLVTYQIYNKSVPGILYLLWDLFHNYAGRITVKLRSKLAH